MSYEVNLDQQGDLAVALGTENNVEHASTTARLTLQSQVIRVGEEGNSEPVTVTTPTATFANGASVLVTPDYRGDFVYGDTEEYRVLTAEGGINGNPTLASSSILYTALESGDSDDQPGILSSEHGVLYPELQ